MSTGLDRLSFHQANRMDLSTEEFLRGCAAAGVTRVTLMRKKVEAFGTQATKRLLDELGIQMTMYASVGGWASGVDLDGDRVTLEESVRRLDQAVELGAPIVVTTCGPMVEGKDLPSARRRVAEGLVELAPHAAARGLMIAVEPHHPATCPNVTVVPTLRYALDLVEMCPPESVGACIDIGHIWWEPELDEQVRRAGRRIVAVQLADADPKGGSGRPLMGEGCIDLAAFRRMLEREGYTGPFQVLAGNADLRAMPMEALTAKVIASFYHFMA